MTSLKPGLGLRLGYSLGGAMFSVKEAAYAVFVILFYTQVLGLSGTAAGVALAVAVLVDCVSDPIIGAWSDQLESRWGRRHPFLVASTAPLGLGFIGLFWVPDLVIQEQTLLAGWLLFWSIWVRTAVSVFAIPHLALSAEMTNDYRERSSIIGARLFFVFTGSVLIPAVALLSIFDQQGDVDGRFVENNYVIYAFASCALCLMIGGVSIWSTRSLARPSSTAGHSEHPSLRQFIMDFFATLRLENFRQLIAFEGSAMVAYGVLISTHILADIYYWELDSDDIALLLALPSLAGVSLALLSVKWLGRRLAKHDILRWSVGLLMADAVWPYLLRFAGWMPENGHPLVLWLLVLQMMIWMFLFILRGISSQSLTVDMADENDLLQGKRQEGALFAGALFAQKLATAVGPLYIGVALDAIGLTRGMEPGTVPDETLNGLIIWFAIGVLIPMAIALVYSFRVSLTEDRLHEIQKALRERDQPA
ncbi:MAG: MFS transporter [Pseudomonadota bacterium]